MEKSHASNDGEYAPLEIVALGGPVRVGAVSQQHPLFFLPGVVIKRRNGIAQAVTMGDLIAIETTTATATTAAKTGRPKKSFWPGRWSVAQVLGFRGTDHVIVLHLRHVKEVIKLIANAKFVTEYVRVDNSLAVMIPRHSINDNDFHWPSLVPVHRILPIAIRMSAERIYQHGNYLRYICDDLIEEWSFQCHFVLPEVLDGSQPAQVKDPAQYLLPPSSLSATSTSSSMLPQSVMDALLRIDMPNVDVKKLAKRLAAQYHASNPAGPSSASSSVASRFQVLSTVAATAGAATISVRPREAPPVARPTAAGKRKQECMRDDDVEMAATAASTTRTTTKRARQTEAPKPTTVIGKNKTIKQTTTVPEAARGDDDDNTSVRTKAIIPFHVALGPVCFQKQIKQSVLLFYDTITLEKSWQIHVGSMVVANHQERRAAPAQVLSIYRHKDDDNAVLVQVRWFYKLNELPPQLVLLPRGLRKDEIIEVDEDVAQIKPAQLVRPLKLFSRTNQVKTRSKDTFLCRYAFSIRQFSFSPSDTLTPITHWSGQESTRIGLDCPKAFPGKIPALLQAYGGLEKSSVVTTDQKARGAAVWSELELSRVVNVTAGTVVVAAPDGTSFFEYIEWRPVSERWAKGSTATARLCKARIGDTVCLMTDAVDLTTTTSSTAAMCDPFAGPWRLVQLVAIYRPPGQSGVRFEVRQCLRWADLPASVQSWCPQLQHQTNEFFESDIVERHVPSSRLLVPAQVMFKQNHGRRSFEKTSIRVSCPYMYLSKIRRIQSLISHEDEVVQKSWFVQRGICSSAIVHEVVGLMDGMQFCFPSPPPPSGPLSFATATSNVGELVIGPRLCVHDPDTGLDTIISCSFRPRRDTILDSSYVLPDHGEVWWKCRIGDVVAVDETSSPVLSPQTISHQWPFTVSWRPAQVLAFTSDVRGECEVLQVRLRFFQFQSGGDCPDHEGCLPSVCPLADVDPNWQNASRLLGPLLLIPARQATVQYRNPWGWWYPFTPTNAVIYQSKTVPLASLLENGMKMLLQGHWTNEKFLRVVNRLEEGEHFTGEGVQLPLLCAIDGLREKHYVDAKSSVALVEATTVRTVGPPLYKDSSASYFGEVSVKVPVTLFTSSPLNDSVDLNKSNSIPTCCVWTARIGDIVILRCDTSRSKSHPFVYCSSRNVSSPSFGPFHVPAAVGEIVTMRKEGDGNILLEIRWFYRESELSGCSKSEEFRCEEVLESDLFNDVAAEHLLAPVRLHSQPCEVIQDLSIEGLPLVELHCSRFWSAIRKCSVPVAGLDGRVARGRAMSRRVSGNASLASALKSLTDKEGAVRVDCQADQSDYWKSAFEKTISKLSLTDAAKETDYSLDAIVGREVERRKISAFVQDALNGSQESMKRPSLFVAGPPGTGKTATIRAVVRDLQSKLVLTSSRQMRFIILNGMETRHPHDIYGMLWDELEPNGNGRLNSKKAASKLKKFFTTDTNDKPSELIVVMLDEIDYIVTKGQEVLYDMFDLPLLSMEKKSGKQLLMIGVSNMLNLPDKLHPRVQSRIGSARVFFKSYGVEETNAILLSKVKAAAPNYDVFHSEAITYASKKTALMSGDIRKAFQMCKQAAELVLEAALKSEEKKRMVLIDDVVRVSRDSFNSAQSRTIALCSSLEALLIVTLASLSKTTGREFGGFDVEELVTKMASVAHAHGDVRYLPPPNLEETLTMLRSLGGSNLITLDSPQNASLSYRASLAGSGGAWPLVSLPIDDIAVLVALKNTDHHRLAEKHLGRQQ